MGNLGWYDMLLGASLLAALGGLGLLLPGETDQDLSDRQITTENLLRMTFVYWTVYCIVAIAQKLLPSEIHPVTVPLRLTGLLTYVLTFSSLLCLPLHYFEARRQRQTP